MTTKINLFRPRCRQTSFRPRCRQTLFRPRCRQTLAICALLLPLLSYGDTFNVTTTADGTATNTLRGAITQADLEGPAGSPHVINVPAGTYNLTMGEISYGNNTGTLQIVGAGAGSTIINMTTTGQDRILMINPSGAQPDVDVTITGVSFTNGVLTSDSFGGGAILCGGPTNIVTLQNCIFKSNSTNSGSGVSGGALAIEGGGTISITGCTFATNTESSSDGGAIYYNLSNSNSITASGSLSITGSTFTGNTVTAAGAQGGAIDIAIQGGVGTSAITITGNNFTDNQAMATGGLGGAIGISNEISSSNTAYINYNRFYANKASAIPDVAVTSAPGNVDLTNNWWGSNSAPAGAGDPHAAITGSGGSGSMLYSPWLRLSSTSGAAAVCSGSEGNSEVMTASFATNSASQTVASTNLTALVGAPISFTTNLGILSNAQATIQTNDAATVDFQSSGTFAVNVEPVASVHFIVDSVTATDAVAAANIPLLPVTIAGMSTSGSVMASSSNPVITNVSCGAICYVVPSGAQPVTGTINASVTIDPSLQSYNGNPYLTRHIDIEPGTGGNTATATVTLYFMQSEFNTYNAALTNTAYRLPTGPTDAVGMANLTVNQFHGTGTAPGNYSGWAGAGPSYVTITPGAANVVWNGFWWQVTFPVTGFSGFFITGSGPVTLPVVLQSFTGQPQSGGVQLSWAVNDQLQLSDYQVQTSTDGKSFSVIGTVAATTYHFFQSSPAPGPNYYRLKIINLDGSYVYSNVIEVNFAGASNTAVQVLNNPFSTSCSIKITAVRAGSINLRLSDMSGNMLWQQSETLSTGVNTIALPQPQSLVPGIYVLSITGVQIRQTIKLMKID
jgi:hypothetical protein